MVFIPFPVGLWYRAAQCAATRHGLNHGGLGCQYHFGFMLEVFCSRIKDARGGLSQSAFAKRLELGQVTYGRYEIGTREPDLKTLSRIGLALGMSIDYLLGLTDDPTPPGPGREAARTSAGGVIADLDELRTRADQAQESLSNLLMAIDKFKKEARR